MGELFLTVLDMSLTASYVIIFVVLARLLLKKAPKIVSYVLWSVVAFRLVTPFSFESVFSLIPESLLGYMTRSTVTVEIPRDIIYTFSHRIDRSTGAIGSFGAEALDSFVNKPLPAQAAKVSVNPLQVSMEIGAYIWIFGIIALLVYSLVSVLLLKNRLKSAQLIEQNIYLADNLKTPFVLGLISPKIYLPAGLGKEEQSYILLHEKTHIYRKDHIIKILAFLIVSVHWFNPLVWLAFRLMSMDMELSCDEKVLRVMNKDIKKSYASSLLSLAAGRHILTGSPLAFGEGNVKGRIKNVLNYKKPKFWVIVLSIVIVAAIGAGLAANPRPEAGTGPGVSDEPDINSGPDAAIGPDSGIDGQIAGFAIEFMNRDIANYESNPEVKIKDGKITRLELIATFDNLAGAPIDVYALEYRLLPKDLSKVVMAGGMQTDENGWLKETCSMGSPLLVVSRNNDSAKLIGTLWTGGVEESGGLEQSIKELLGVNTGDEIAKLVEENLAIIMSSPKQASNPNEYILAHQEEYEKIKKFGGEQALQYMLSQFEKGNAEGLRGHIMMKLCKDLLGARNNVTDETLTPQEWYKALSIRQEIKLPDFRYDGDDPIEKLVYATEVEKNSRIHEGFTIVAPKIFGSYEEEGLLKVFVTTYSATYKLYRATYERYGYVLDMVGGGVIPSAITYKKDDNGNYVLYKYEQAKDGALWEPSIRDYCTMPVSGKKIPGLADKIISHYGDRNDLRKLHMENLIKHLRANGINEVALINYSGEIESIMGNPQYDKSNSNR